MHLKKSDPPIIVKAHYPVEKSKVWAAICQVEKMRQWFFPNIPDFLAEVGFQTQFTIENEGRTFTHNWTVKEVIKEEKLVFDWSYNEYPGNGYVVFELSQDTEGTSLQLTNIVTEDYPTDIPEFKQESCVGGWNYFLNEALHKFLTTS